MEKQLKQLVLNKGGEKYIFRYEEGMEDNLLENLVASAKDERLEFDWFDAAVLSFKLTHSLMSQADNLLKRSNDIKFNELS
jgi:hypothetical protein